MPDIYKANIKYLVGVGEKKAEYLNKELNIYTIKDLLFFFPYKHIDRSKFYKINEIHNELQYIQVIGKLENFKIHGEKYKQRLTANLVDSTGRIELIWFKGVDWLIKTLSTDREYVVFGKANIFNQKASLVHPEIEEVSEYNAKINSSIQPVYSIPDKLKKSYINSKFINKILQVAIKKHIQNIEESLPNYIIEKLKLLSITKSIINIHYPSDLHLLQKAQFRLKFEELFYIQLNMLKQRFIRKKISKGFVFHKVGDYFNNFYNNNLKFTLTNAQKKVLKEIRKDCGSGKHMNRLLQGDVGSGKTLVALMSMLIAIDNNYQTCIMAPTEILAKQHYKSVSSFLQGLDIKIHILTGSTKKKQRNIIHKDLLSGENQILIGTHALIEDAVKFKNLALVIIDEQHRFGVMQRAKLWKKNINPPHMLVMTATPIPRTLAMTLYGDLDISVIDELPPGRQAIKTFHSYDAKRLRVFSFIKKQIELGRQIYIVYPLIKESEKMDYKDLEDGYESITRAFPPPEYSVSILHGKMKPDEKEKSMQLFINKQTQIMVSTTVIEVGVDVPNASVMIIESAEKFGLSQLHQLRGRVGRGVNQSYCILMTSYKLSADARKRLETMVSTNDGFEIAEADLKLRGPGNIDGTQQSGIPFDLKIANLAKDNQILVQARDYADYIIKNHNVLSESDTKIIQKQLKQLDYNSLNWGSIS